jgi:hypothetical protein
MMTTEVTTLSLEAASKEIDKIVDDAGPFAVAKVTGFASTLKLAEAVGTLRDIFLKHPGIQKTIRAMQDSKLGFLTDRSSKAIARAEYDGKKLKPYAYEEIAECCIEGMLQGYRITGNEFNVIAGGFYPAKNGKWRKIIEHPGLSDFKFTTSSPAYQSDGKFAKVQCYASWLQDGNLVTLGVSEKDKGKEDTLVFTVRVNSAMGEDAVVGKAISKLFSRVLMRLSGKVMPEATDLEYGDVPNLPEYAGTGASVAIAPVEGAVKGPEFTGGQKQEPAKPAPSGAPTVEELKEQVTAMAERAGIPADASDIFEGRYIQEKKATWKKETDLDTLALIIEQSEFVVSDMKIKWQKWESEIREYINTSEGGQSRPDYDPMLAKEYIFLRGSGLEGWVAENPARILTMPQLNQLEIKQKWERVVKKPFPEIHAPAPAVASSQTGELASKKPFKIPELEKMHFKNGLKEAVKIFDGLVKDLADMDNPKFTVEAFKTWLQKDFESRGGQYTNIENLKAATLVHGKFHVAIQNFLKTV